jgi:hypothetical protein
MKKSVIIIIGCIVSVVLFQAFTNKQDPEFKNLKILPKDISKHDLDTIMHHFSASLGVRCNFCHVASEDMKKWDFSSDAKPEKNIARQMMLMAIDINKNYFKMAQPGGMDHDHDMNNKDNDHDMNKNMPHDSAEIKGHDMDTSKEHGMDTTMAMAPTKYMLRSVTCYTCHRGDPHPQTKTPPPKEGPPPPPKGADKK